VVIVSFESEQLERRNRVRRRLAAALTPEERVARAAALLDQCWQVLAQSPEAMDRYWRRNLKKRAVRRDPPPTS
jgi:hypothetical protein